MAHHQLAVGRGVHVELDAGGPGLQGVRDGVQGRRRRLPGAALVRVGDHPALEPHRRLAHPIDGNSRGPGAGHRRRGRGRAPPRRAYPRAGVLDHLLVDVIGTIRASFDRALLQRQAVEERFQVDVFLGDVSWETSYSLPGEEQPPRVRADVSVDWPTWSQTSYRSWSIGEPPDELPEVVIEVALRVQRMAEAPDTEKVMAALPGDGAAWATRWTWSARRPRSSRCAPTPRVSTAPSRWAAEATYEGSVRFSEQQLEDPSTIAPGLRRPDPLDRLHADLPGRPPLHVPAPGGGRRLTRLRRPPGPRHRPRSSRLRLPRWPPAASSAPAAPPPSQGLVLDRPTPQHVALVDQQGRAVSAGRAAAARSSSWRPFLSLCQDECPLVTGAFIALQRDLRAAGLANRVVFVEATVDPGRDSVARLAAYQKEFGADWDLWTGTPDRRRRVLEAVRCRVPDRPRGAAAEDRLVHRHPAHLRRRRTPTATSSSIPDGRERFVDATAPNLDGQARTRS